MGEHHLILMRDKEIVRLRHEGLTLKEISERCGTSISNAHRISGAKKPVGRTSRHYWTQERIVSSIQEWVRVYGELPTAHRWGYGADYELVQHPSLSVVLREFGRWSEAIRNAGYEPRSPGRPKGSLSRSGPYGR